LSINFGTHARSLIQSSLSHPLTATIICKSRLFTRWCMDLSIFAGSLSQSTMLCSRLLAHACIACSVLACSFSPKSLHTPSKNIKRPAAFLPFLQNIFLIFYDRCPLGSGRHRVKILLDCLIAWLICPLFLDQVLEALYDD